MGISMTRSWYRTIALRRLALVLSVTLIGAGLVAGCSGSSSGSKATGTATETATATVPPASAAETWDRDGLADALPCLLTLGSDGTSGLKASGLDGATIADALWEPTGGSGALLLDAEGSGPRVAISSSSASEAAPADIRDTLLVLDADGSVKTASEPTTDYPLLSGAVFLGKGDVVWLRRRETQTAIETTVGVTALGSGATIGVKLAGAWPKHRFLAGLVPLRSGNLVGVVVKIDGTPAANDEFALVAAEYANGTLTARPGAYKGDNLFTLALGPKPGTLVYARAKGEESSVADELVELTPAAGRWTSRVLLRDARCDPGYDYQQVCGGGPAGSVLFRQAGNPANQGIPVSLMRLPASADAASRTGIVLDTSRAQWMWVAR
jgi:hypothetical protein